MAAQQRRITISLSKELGAAVERFAAEQWTSPALFCRYAVAHVVATRQAAEATCGYVQPRSQRMRGKALAKYLWNEPRLLE
jgi:hypothetical protein